MRLWAAVGCVVVFLIVCDAYFDCRRKGMNCVTGYCKFETGDCDCPGDMVGKDCGLNTTLISNSCDFPCLNDGTCFEEGGNLRCYCNESYFGLSCENERATVVCNSENMTMTITPYQGFQGVVLIPVTDGDSNCALEKKEDGGIVSYETSLSLVEGCAVNELNNTPSVGDTTYTRDVKIQYNPLFMTKYDQTIEISCALSSANVSSLDGNMPGVSVDESKTPSEKQKVESRVEPVILEVQKQDGGKITEDIYVGQELRLYIYLPNTNRYKTLNVESCVAVNGRPGDELKTQELIKDRSLLELYYSMFGFIPPPFDQWAYIIIMNSCPVSYEIIMGPLKHEKEQSVVIVNFMAFKFVDSKKISFDCKVRHCVEGDGRCEPKTCFGRPDTGFGKRRRRDADWVNDDEEVLVTRSITVLDPESAKIITKNRSRPVDCIQRTEILTSIIILATAIIVMFIVCFFLALKLIKSRSKCVRSEIESTVCSDGSKLKIPRVTSVY